MLIRRIARPLLSTAMVAEGVNALRETDVRAEHASPVLAASQQHLPHSISAMLGLRPQTLVRINAATQICGGVLLALGRAPRLSSFALSGSFVPTTINSYAFWEEEDPIIRATKRADFLKNLGLVGGLMIAAVDTEAKPSLGWRARRAARRARASVSGTPASTLEGLTEGAHRVAAHGREFAETAGDTGRRLAMTIKDEAPHVAEAAAERGSEAARFVREHGSALAEATKRAAADLQN